MRSKRLIQFKPLVLSIHLVTIALGTAIVTSVHAQATVNIAAGDLAQALNQYALQQNVNLILEGQSLTAYKTSGLQGTYSIEAGFNQLLAHTPFQIQKVSHGYTLVAKVQPQKVQARDMGQLNRIDVMTTAQQGVNGANSGVTQLPVITVEAEQNGSAADGYLVKNIEGIGIWGERSLQDTPYSMSVVSGELIENVVAENMDQIFKMNPATHAIGASVLGSGDARSATIRGFGVNNPIVNGISQAGPWTNVPMMQDIERVEIISGATGFLYGGGRVGGAINYTTKKPTIENLRTLSIGSYGGDSHYAHIDLSGQIDQNNTLGYRINTLYQGGENSAKVDREQKALSLIVDYKPTDDFYTDIKYSYKDISYTPAIWFFSVDDRSSIQKNINYSPSWARNETESHQIENSIRWNINDILTLRTNLMYEEVNGYLDSIDAYYENNLILADSYILTSPEQKTKNQGVNINLDSKFTTFDIHHILTVGYLQNSSKHYAGSWSYDYYIDKDISLNELKKFPRPNIIRDTTKPASTKTEYQNILIGDDITFNSQWSALVGINYASTISKNYNGTSGYDESVFTPTLSVIYKPFENLSTYATYIESLEAGTIVAERYQNAKEVLEPYVSTQYEVGAKYSLNDRALINASLFRIEKANSYEVATDSRPILTQDGEQIHQGLELGITGKLTDHLTMMGGATWMDLKVTKGFDRWAAMSLGGKKPINAPSQMAKLFAEYQMPTIEGFYLNGGVYYTGKRYGNASNTDILSEYTLFDMGARYQIEWEKYPTTFNLNISNLTNKVYWVTDGYIGDPRTVAFSVKTRF